MTALALSLLRRWLRLAPGPDALARWPVDEATWTAFLAMERRRGGPPYNELPMPESVPAGGLEVIAEADGLWLAGRRVALPQRGNPEILEARLVDGDPVATLEMTLKTAPRVNSSGAVLPPEFSRLSVPVPGPAWREARRAEAHFNRDTPGKPDFFHGRGDGSDPEDLSTCPACGFQTHKFRSQCERCGMGLQSRRWSRRFGALLIVCGLILTALMGGVLRFVGPILYQVVVYGDSARFNGTRIQAVVVLTLLGGVFLFGVLCLAYGGWQVATGRTHLRGARAIAKFFGVIMALAFLILWLK
ncbi:zinc finger Ran-binding domain-containing protein [Arenimonas terrae]|uniref:Uncharacterized protein n=1 Tax=Arenimonas terrae TaxID=2546226 RepID=A0A5C4RVE2_9GAMM|nr:zinc finger Ran-binding domain-containing protein [Arenimonas terrae]TNJ34811.1 hypothetical protein E1B00_03240 [Arenimonas terrae]